jgi:hypothetical protein
LAVGGAGEGFLRAGFQDRGKVGRKDTRAEFEDFPGGRGGLGQVCPHSDPLGSLAGEEEGKLGHQIIYRLLNGKRIGLNYLRFLKGKKAIELLGPVSTLIK